MWFKIYPAKDFDEKVLLEDSTYKNNLIEEY